MTKRKKIILVLVILLSITFIKGWEFRMELYNAVKYYTQQKPELKLFRRKQNNFTLKNGEEYKLINSAIKQDYNILFSGNIVNFDTLIIGKGTDSYLSSYLMINQDSIIFYKKTRGITKKSYKHHLSLKNNLSINIYRKVDLTVVTIINEKDTLKLSSDFVGMNNPFIHSYGSTIDVNKFEFTYDKYNSDVYIFGDSYVNCGTTKRWPYYLYKNNYKFFCDGLPGGRSIDSFDFLNSALSVHTPKYVIWCLGMNDGGDRLGVSPSWKHYVKKMMELCSQNNITLILSTVPSVPTIDNTRKNKFVRESGYRYIDFNKAVLNSNGNWRKGMLSDDGVHPSETGAEILADEFLKDFPEIKNYIK